LLTNNPEKVKAVAESGIACQQIPLHIEPNEFNKKYLDTKAARLGHLGNTSQGGK
jgi:3,4-dihydroxy 2-butanone 4-phosphate synthase/GTP cyclohydrolase II